MPKSRSTRGLPLCYREVTRRPSDRKRAGLEQSGLGADVLESDEKDAEEMAQHEDGSSIPDFGPPPYGIPYVTVCQSTPRVPITFVDYTEESDAGAPGSSGTSRTVPDECHGQSRSLSSSQTSQTIEGGVPGGGSEGVILSSSISAKGSCPRHAPHSSTPTRTGGKQARLRGGVRFELEYAAVRRLDVRRRRRARDTSWSRAR